MRWMTRWFRKIIGRYGATSQQIDLIQSVCKVALWHLRIGADVRVIKTIGSNREPGFLVTIRTDASTSRIPPVEQYALQVYLRRKVHFILGLQLGPDAFTVQVVPDCPQLPIPEDMIDSQWLRQQLDRVEAQDNLARAHRRQTRRSAPVANSTGGLPNRTEDVFSSGMRHAMTGYETRDFVETGRTA